MSVDKFRGSNIAATLLHFLQPLGFLQLSSQIFLAFARSVEL